jgi:pyroglutamyl-peptidase
MKWLITAFEPFDGAASNSSLILLRHLQGIDWVRDRVEFFAPLPVSYARAWPVLMAELGRRPGVEGVLALGQAESRPRLSLERLALNWVDSIRFDNDGARPEPGPLGPGPEVLWSPIPWQEMGDGDPWRRSYSAGTFVCNALFYDLLKWAKENSKQAGFVHVPVLASQKDSESVRFAAAPGMDDPAAGRGLEDIVRFLCAR